MRNVTAIIITKDEEKNIQNCINSIKSLCERIVVVDSGSNDRTLEIAEELGADTYYHEFDYYANQWNWGLDNTNITTDWVIRIDADEQFTEELNREIEHEIDRHANDDVNGFVLHEWYFFMGKKLKHCSGNKRKLMVFKYGKGRIENRKRDAHTLLNSGKSKSLKNRFLHNDFKSIDCFIKKYNWYATRETQDYISYVNGKEEEHVTDKELQKTRNKKFGLYYKAPFSLDVIGCFYLSTL